jgi:WD40 repeat protein
LVTGASQGGGHGGEVFACAFTPDGRFVLSGGWDGYLRLWEGSTGAQVTAFPAAAKAVSACAVAPDGGQWLSGALDGLLAFWDPASHRQVSVRLAHTRPISAIVFGTDGTLVTSSWDRSLMVWPRTAAPEGRGLWGHSDVVAGCRLTPDGGRLLSWSHDRTLRLWDVPSGRTLLTLGGHLDRVSAAAVSPDGARAASGSRDRVVRLWDLKEGREDRAVCLGAEVRACFFLLDGESLVTVDAHGRLAVHGLPALEERHQLATRLAVQCADLSPAGDRIALGCDDGRVRLVAVDGLEDTPLLVRATPTVRPVRGLFRRRLARSHSGTCPRCRQPFELPDGALGRPTSCPGCGRLLRLSAGPRL